MIGPDQLTACLTEGLRTMPIVLPGLPGTSAQPPFATKKRPSGVINAAPWLPTVLAAPDTFAGAGRMNQSCDSPVSLGVARGRS